MLNSSQVYQEVYELMIFTNPIELIKVPDDVWDFLDEKRDKEFVTKIDRKDIYNANNIDKRTINIISWMYMTYILDGEEKDRFINQLKENEYKENEQKLKEYNIDIFEKRSLKERNESREEREIAIIDTDEPLLTKILKRIKKIFQK